MNPYLEGNPYLIKKEPNQAGRQALSLALQLYYLKNKSGTKTPQWKIGDTTPGEPLNIPSTTVEPEGLDAFVFGKGGEQALVPETAMEPLVPETVMEPDLSAFNFGEKAETLTEGLSAFDFGMEEAAAGSAAELGGMGSLDAFTFGGGVEGLSAFELGGGASGGYTFGGGVEPFVVDSSLSLGAEAGAGSSSSGAGTSLGGVLAYITAAEMVKGQRGQLDRGWDERDTWGKLTSAPANPLWPVELMHLGSSNELSKLSREIARIEQQALAPIDWLFGIKNKMGRCIIVSACTSRDSYEVNIARKFRDRHMDEEELTGYYALCVFVVPFIRKYPLVRKIVKKVLVDRLVDYGEWRLDMKQDMKYATSGVVKKMFLGLCRHIGQGVDTVLGQEV